MDWMCLRSRENGYHDVRMVMQTVYLYDQIVITKTKQPGVKAETNLFYLPVDENNLACRAAKMLIDEFNITEGVHISMDKKIPVSAGMAGGSADAAAVLFGVNKMFGLGLSMTELEERGVKLGADVPYCLMRGTVLAEGIGEKLTPLWPAQSVLCCWQNHRSVYRRRWSMKNWMHWKLQNTRISMVF